MGQGSIREELVARLDSLTEEQIAALLQVARAMQSTERPEPYDAASDPTIGFIQGPSDLASRTKDILREEVNPRSGWTQKDEA